MSKIIVAVSTGGFPRELVTVDHTVYPGGEVNINTLIPDDPVLQHASNLLVVAQLETAEDFMLLAQVKDALDGMYLNHAIDLQMPYVPYARQDRRVPMTKGNQSLSIRWFAKMLNGLNFNSVEIWDPHSDVTPALIDRVVPVRRHQLVGDFMNHVKYSYSLNFANDVALVAPDAGALKATYDIAAAYRIPTICVGEKKRDPVSGKITNTVVHNVEQLAGKHVIICDDICDGGATFLHLADAINAANVGVLNKHLYVTHGIFSKGTADLCDRFDTIYASNAFDKFSDMWEQQTTHTVSLYSQDLHHQLGITFFKK